jgi:16S rRNA (guanine966-N2)-methyltransferase
MLAEACQMLQENGWLAAKANIYLERGKDRDRPALPEDWVLTHEKVAGKVSYSLASTGTPT